MTSASAILTNPMEPSRGVTRRILTAFQGPAAWSLADQAAVSVGNFVTTVLVIRSLTPTDSGLFGILLDVTFFLNSVHAPLLTYPLSVRGASTDGATTARLTFASLVLTLMSGILLIVIGCAAGIAVGEASPIIWASVAAMLWQMQEVARRGLMSRLRIRTAVLGDSLSYLGQAIATGVLCYYGALTLERLFMVMAATSAVAMVVQVLQVGWRILSVRQVWSHAVEFWVMGRWLLAGNLTGLICIPAFAWVLVYFHGLEAGAINLALLSLLKISHPVMSAVSNLIVPAVAHANKSHTGQALRAFLTYAAVGAAMLLPFFAILLVIPVMVLRTVYSGDNTDVYATYGATMQIMVLSYVVLYVANMTTAFLTGLQRTRDVFFGHLAHTVGSLAIGLPMVAVWGITGVAWGGGIAVGARLVANAVAIRRAV